MSQRRGLKTHLKRSFYDKAEARREKQHLRELSHVELCSGKVVRATQDDALAAAARIHESDGVVLRAYRCPNTSHWHLTSRL